MSDRMLAMKQSEMFKRELDLLNALTSIVEDTEHVRALFSAFSLPEEEEEIKPVVYGPLSEAFYTVNCPFVWSEYVTNEEMVSVITSIKEKIDMKAGDWKAICFTLYFAFLYARMGKLKSAFKYLENFSEYCTKNAEDEFYEELMDGLHHGMFATKAHICFLNGDAELADEIISSAVPLKDLSNPSKAALIALNAEVMQEYGLNYKEMAMEMMKVAVKLDPDDKGLRRGSWYYTVGKLLGQMRRAEHRAGMPSQEELQMLERAAKINPHPVILATLADSYREASVSAVFNRKMQVSNEISFKMLSEAKQLYTKAFELDGENYSTLRKCGNGLMKLPDPHKDINLAKQCLEKAISLNPRNSSAYQSLGTMEEKYFKNLSGALKYFQLSYEKGNYISGSFIVQVKRKMDRNYNPISDLDKFIGDLKKHRSDLKAEFLIIKGEYLFFQRNDLLEAAKVWMEAIKIAPKSENVMNHTSRFQHRRPNDKPYIHNVAGRLVFNVYECLKHEITSALKHHMYREGEVLLKEVLSICDNDSTK